MAIILRVLPAMLFGAGQGLADTALVLVGVQVAAAIDVEEQGDVGRVESGLN